MSYTDLERRFAEICDEASAIGVDRGSPEGDRSVLSIEHRKKRWPNGPSPTHERDADVGAMSSGTLRLESIRITVGIHQRARQVDLRVGARLPIETTSGVVLCEIVRVDADRPDPYGFQPVGGSGLAWGCASTFADHWPGPEGAIR